MATDFKTTDGRSAHYYRICVKVRGFLKMSTSLHTRLAAKMYVGDRQFLQVTENMEVLKSQGRTLISHVSKWDGQHLQPEQTDDDELWIAWENNVFAKQLNKLHWFNVSVTSVIYYKKIMLQCRLIRKPHTYWQLRPKVFAEVFQ